MDADPPLSLSLSRKGERGPEAERGGITPLLPRRAAHIVMRRVACASSSSVLGFYISENRLNRYDSPDVKFQSEVN